MLISYSSEAHKEIEASGLYMDQINYMLFTGAGRHIWQEPC